MALLAGLSSSASAGIIVGTIDDGPPAANDSQSNVLMLIDQYNITNDPDLPTLISLFGKSDDSGFPFDGSNGLDFWADLAMTDLVESAAELHSLNVAYFTSSDPGLFYYSVKGGNKGLTLYTIMPGKNLLQNPGNANGSPAAISHVSFWTAVPEPTSGLLWIVAVAILGGRWRR